MSARSVSGDLPAPGRFQPGCRTDLRSAPRWHRLSYVIRRLPAEIARLAPQLGVGPGDRVLDYGCAELPFRHLFPQECEYIGADLAGNPHATLEIAADGSLPIEDASVDAVLSTQVLEHVDDPDLYLAEASRVLRPGGRMLLSTHGIMVFHPDPVDYWRWTCSGLERIVGEAGFEVERFDGIMGLSATGLQLFQDGVLFRLPPRAHKPFCLVTQTLIALADRYDSDESRRLNALVFALVGRRLG